MKATAHTNHCTRFKRADVERFQIEALLQLRIPGQYYLEAAIEQKAINAVGPHSPTDAVGSLEHLTGDTRSNEILGAHQPGKTRAHDDDVDHANPFHSSAMSLR